jgi:thioredoxin-dependent peroxiredoxin
MNRLVKLVCGVALGVLATLFLAAGSVNAEEKEEGTKVQEGKPAPDIELEAANIEKALPDKKDAKTLTLKAFKGKKNIVLFFYPKAMTPGCTVESCGFRDRIKKFEDVDTVVIGISTDKLADQVKFTEKENLNFPLFADPEKKVTRDFGALNAGRGLAARVTFVIDKNGVVRKIYRTGTVNPSKHPDEVLDYIKENLSGK